MFGFFRDNLAMNMNNVISPFSDKFMGNNTPEISPMRDFIKSNPMAMLVLRNVMNNDYSHMANFTMFKTVSDDFILSSTCPSYMIPHMFSIIATNDNLVKKSIETFTTMDTRTLKRGQFYRNDIFDFNLKEIGKYHSSSSSSDMMQKRNDFLLTLPATIRGSLKKYVTNMFFGFDTAEERRYHVSFDKFFQRLAIFTVLNEFQVFKMKNNEHNPTFNDFISAESMMEELYSRFHTGQHTVHDETIDLIHAIFSLPNSLYSHGKLDQLLWKFFIINSVGEMAKNYSFEKLIDTSPHAPDDSDNKNINALMHTHQSDISVMMKINQNEEIGSELGSSSTMNNLINQLCNDIYGTSKSKNSLADIYETLVLQQWGFDLSPVKNIKYNDAYQKAISDLHNYYLDNHNNRNKNDFDSLKEYVCIFNMLIYIAQKINLPEIDNWKNSEYQEYTTLTSIIFKSDLLNNDNYNFDYQASRIKTFGRSYLDHRGKMPLELILGICGVHTRNS